MAGITDLKLFSRGQHYLTHTSLQMDNMTACHYINHTGGTVSINLCMLDLDMWKWCKQRNIHISAVYIPGQLNLVADILSPLISPSSRPRGGQRLRHSTKVLCQSGVAGVLKNKKIPFLVI